jgi:hypothetical protein
VSGSAGGRGAGLAVVTVVVLAAVVAAAVFLSRDRQSNRSQAGGVATADTSPPPAASEVGSSRQSSGEAPGTYKAVKKPCKDLDVSALERLLGPAKPNRDPLLHMRVRNSAATAIICAVDFGRPAHSYVRLEINVFDDMSAEHQYEGLRGLLQEAPVTDVPGLGQGAYSYVHTETGPHVVSFDGNLHLTAAVSTVSGDARAPQRDVIAGLIEVSRELMRVLEA